MAKKRLDPLELLEAIEQLITAWDVTSAAKQSRSKIAAVRLRTAEVVAKLQAIVDTFDPTAATEIFDPADPQVVGDLIALSLLGQPRHSLESLARFYGSGVYAIYYNGDFTAYQPLIHSDHPIYVGVAQPAVDTANTVFEQGAQLYGRLGEHRKSLRHASGLDVNDFECRYLVVKSHWQRTAEQLLIRRFRPIWNKETRLVYGFGKHGDSAETRKNSRSPWDTLHSGRTWATNEQNKPNVLGVDEILELISKHFREHPPEKLVLPPELTLGGRKHT